jgi:GntR family transcriptional regulator, transcriptional repressor for pyruvate dehydrogenase complex
VAVRVRAINRPNLAMAITSQMRDWVLNGELAPGEQLPGHRELAQMFGVSMAAVREAISALVGAGVLEAQPGLGTFVSWSPRVEVASATWLGAPEDEQELRELIEARRALEGTIARLAAQRATDDQVRALRAAVADMRRHVTNPTAYLESDVTFHMVMATAAQNRVLLRTMYAIRSLLRRELLLNLRRALSRHGDISYSADSHARLAEAIAAHDPDAAGSIMEEIVQRAAGYLEEREPGSDQSKERGPIGLAARERERRHRAAASAKGERGPNRD